MDKTTKPQKTEGQKHQEFKHNMMCDIQQKGHSFPHWDTCSTCEDDFDEVFNAGRASMLQDVLELIEDEYKSCVKIHKNCKIHRDILIRRLKAMLTEEK